MKKAIVITSIFTATKAVEAYAKIPGWNVIVVGDRKTPIDWQHSGVTYLSPEDQGNLGYDIGELLPWNHYCRKMIGYLYAISRGAEIICDTDDDNIPLHGWEPPPSWSGRFRSLSGDGFVNIYEYFTKEKIWPRGYPLNAIQEGRKFEEREEEQKVGIWQLLANGDPDVDAVYRLVLNNPVDFEETDPIVLDQGVFSPFNSQNTFFAKPSFPLLYLPAFVTFRFTDILRGIVAQPLLWENGYRLGFGPATVFQERNPHDYLKDFESEIPMYLHVEDSAKQALSIIGKEYGMLGGITKIYESLMAQKIVEKRELRLLEAWVRDIRRVTEEKPK